jgi:adenosylcobinamide amidohydrolase
MLAISSGALGGGLGERRWVINATVPMAYFRDDPDRHLSEMADFLALDGSGVGLMTGVDVAERVLTDDGGVDAASTVGLGAPAWAAAPDGHLRRATYSGPTYSGPADPGSIYPGPSYPGTINTVVTVPVRLSEAALVNAATTVAEAKAQALWELGIEATGTASDAICVLCPTSGPAEPYGGPRSTWGARIARAVHAGVRRGGEVWQAGGTAWSER